MCFSHPLTDCSVRFFTLNVLSDMETDGSDWLSDGVDTGVQNISLLNFVRIDCQFGCFTVPLLV